MSVAWLRLAFIAGSAIVSCIVAAGGGSWIEGNHEAVSLIATVFSVLAGFLVAVMAVIADDRLISRKAARVRYMETKNIRARLQRHTLLFQLYLLVMVLSFVATLKIGLPDVISLYLHRAMLGLATFAFLLSFRLPAQITAEYLRRLDEIDRESGDA